MALNTRTGTTSMLIALVAGLMSAAVVVAADSSSSKRTRVAQYAGEKLSLNFTSVELPALFAIFANHSGNRLSIDPAIKGTIAAQYFDVPWDQAMYDIAARHRLSVKVENGTIYVKKNDR
jgi:type II secretory pathway component GspD/PulD (secretin)